MEKILRKMFYKWFIKNVQDFDCIIKDKDLLTDDEKIETNGFISQEIDSKTEEIINLVKDSLEDASSDIEFNLINLLDVFSENKWDVDDEIEEVI